MHNYQGREKTMKNEIKTIQSVQRAIDILNCVGDAGHSISLKEISSKLELNINTARGLAQTLLVNGFLSRDAEHGTYALGYEFLTKSKLVYENQIQRIRDIAHPRMEKITENYGISSWLQISFYRNIYTVETVEPTNSTYSYAPKSGANLPLHASASGKLRIAYMPETERQKIVLNVPLDKLTMYTITEREAFIQMINDVYHNGYATEFEEIDEGISSVAVPIFDKQGALDGTLSIAAPSVKVKGIFNKLLKDLKQASIYISDNISKHYTI